ncbi:MAG: DoxX family protein [Gemmatimonadota bacterium]|jgi:putative oxidoreductase
MTGGNLVSTLSRLFCGVTFIVHGAPKVFNLEAAAGFFESVGLSSWSAIPVAGLELFGGILLVAGFLTRWLSALFILEMAVAIVTVHLPKGWNVFNGGYEFNLALIIMLIGVIVLGPGPFSIDGQLRKSRGGAASPEPVPPGLET